MPEQEPPRPAPPVAESTEQQVDPLPSGVRHARLRSGDRVDRYVISRPIAGGGMGDVYLARDPGLERDVALKMIRRDMLGPQPVESFLREARTTARFNHPNIVVIHEVGSWQGQPFLALEYLDGPTVRDWLDQRTPSLEEALRVALDVTEALVAAHGRGIVHRDLKPSNVIIANDGRARVLDFGLAAALDDGVVVTGGTPKYMAPEQRRNQPPTPAVDIWALGLLVKVLLEGYPEISRTTLPSSAESPASDSSVSSALDALLEAAAHEDPAQRPTALLFRDELVRLLEQVQIEQDLARTRHLLGRDVERGRLLEEAIALRDGGRGGILGIEGEAGLGKTLLLLDFMQRARSAGVRVLHGSADAILRRAPFHAWRAVLKQLISGREEAATGDALPEEAMQGLEALRPVIDAVLQTSKTETWTARLLELETRAEVTTRVLTEVVSRRVSGPLVIVIDDWHWADSASWRLARSVAVSVPQLLLVVSYRPVDPDSEQHDALKKLPRFKSIRLPPLTDGTVGRIVESRYRGAELGGEITRLVVRHAAGNPLFAEELTALAQQSSPSQVRGETSLSAVLHRRLDVLPQPVHDVLTTASAIGRRFDIRIVERIHGREQVRSAFQRLLELGILRQEREGFSFSHDVTRSIAYERLEGEARRACHQAVATALEEMGGDALREHSTLADHWYEAGDTERTVTHAEAAADQALNAGAYREAIRLLRLCLALRPFKASRAAPPEQPMRWRRLLAETHYALGQLAEANEEAQRVLALAGREFPATGLGRRLATAGRLAHSLFLSRRRPGRPAGVAAQGAELEIARALGIAATAAWYFYDEEGMHYAALTAFCRAHRYGNSQTLVMSAGRLGCETAMRGWRRVGTRFETLAREVAAELHDEPATAGACMLSALYRIGIADWARVSHDLDLCQKICTEYRDDFNWCNAQIIRYWSHRYRGMRNEAWETAQAMCDRAERTGNDQHRNQGSRCLALEMLDAGDTDGARRTLEDSLKFLGSGPRPRIEMIPARGALAVAWMRLGEHDRATLEIDETLRMLHSSRSLNSHAALEGISGLCEVLLQAQAESWPHKTAAGWQRALDQSLKALERYQAQFPVGGARYALWRGAAARASGREVAARKWWRRGLVTAADLGLRRDTDLLSRRLELS